MSNWQIEGDYFETCNCDYVCPCITSNMSATPTKGNCLFALVFNIDKGQHGVTPLDGLSFAVIGNTPDVMGKGNGSVGLIIDDKASPGQRDAIAAIASGQEGGPMSAMAPLLPTFLGLESRPIRYVKQGIKRWVEIPGFLEQSLEGMPSPVKPGEALTIDNGAHPANSRLALAKAKTSHVHVFGFDWDDTSGRNNGHFAPFSWQG